MLILTGKTLVSKNSHKLCVCVCLKANTFLMVFSGSPRVAVVKVKGNHRLSWQSFVVASSFCTVMLIN